MDHIFRGLEPSISATPPQSMRDRNEKILLVVFSIITGLTEEITQGRASRFILERYVVIYSPLIRKVLEKVDREECR
jgi:hypothetical protein